MFVFSRLYFDIKWFGVLLRQDLSWCSKAVSWVITSTWFLYLRDILCQLLNIWRDSASKYHPVSCHWNQEFLVSFKGISRTSCSFKFRDLRTYKFNLRFWEIQSLRKLNCWGPSMSKRETYYKHRATRSCKRYCEIEIYFVEILQ